LHGLVSVVGVLLSHERDRERERERERERCATNLMHDKRSARAGGRLKEGGFRPKGPRSLLSLSLSLSFSVLFT